MTTITEYITSIANITRERGRKQSNTSIIQLFSDKGIYTIKVPISGISVSKKCTFSICLEFEQHDNNMGIHELELESLPRNELIELRNQLVGKYGNIE